MDIQDFADKEAELLAEQLEDGTITYSDYRRYIKDLGDELRDYENH